MAKVLVEVIDQARFAKLTGILNEKQLQSLDKKQATALIKKDIVRLSELQRDIESPQTKKEEIKIIESPELVSFLKKPNLLDDLVKDVQHRAVGEDGTIKVIIITATLAKVLNKKSASANLCLNAGSGAGKDYLAEETLNLIPKQFVFARRRISPKLLDYALAKHQGRDWSDYVIYLEDASDKILNSESVKTLMTAKSKQVNVCSVVQDGQVKDLKIFGKPAFIFTSAKAKPKEETLRRVPFCFLDETAKQTLKITERQAEEAEKGEAEEIKETLCKQFFLGLKKIKVKIPYALEIQKVLAEHWIKKSKRLQIIHRTSFPRFLDYIKASVALHQHQRQTDKEGFYLAQPADYEIAREVLLKTTSNSRMIPISKEETLLLKCMKDEFDGPASIAEISVKFTRWEDRHLRTTLDNLASKDFVEKTKVDGEPYGSKRDVMVYSVFPDVFGFNIPTWEELKNCKNNAIETIETNHAIKTNHANQNELHELHELQRKFKGKKLQDFEKEACEMCGKPAELFTNGALTGCKPCIEKELIAKGGLA